MIKMVCATVLVSLSAYWASSCASLHAYSIVLAVPYDGKAVIENEKKAAAYLEKIVQNHGNYSMKAFNRKAISYKVKKTAATTHSFYVLYTAGEPYQTVSFSATGKGPYSKGAWAVNTTTDSESYSNYVQGNNNWEIAEITPEAGIDTLRTAKNILAKIQSTVSYYYRAKVNNNDARDNCNTALWETLVTKEL